MKKFLLPLMLFMGFFAKAQNTSQSYIEKYKDAAISIMHDYGIPASVTLAIAMHESASGNSKLAQKNNNQFGMKGRHSYKTYDSVLESFEDFARIISKRNLADKFDSFDYKSWAKGIQRGGYASSSRWSAQVLSLIKKFQLNSLDEKPELEAQ
ncbi:glucosaminidase domain-containing protein [uncultured Mucilaginibacter sp.]|uniref:glucosaminidase domain-containing protein n=1 Tax=uncultured Mucilaginibacter sp. TaxID=797541 RepID=UPI00262842AB|nr:glucosaminidase domain-containing protein [uncultured Mucilaginibacter sp.]